MFAGSIAGVSAAVATNGIISRTGKAKRKIRAKRIANARLRDPSLQERRRFLLNHELTLRFKRELTRIEKANLVGRGSCRAESFTRLPSMPVDIEELVTRAPVGIRAVRV